MTEGTELSNSSRPVISNTDDPTLIQPSHCLTVTNNSGPTHSVITCVRKCKIWHKFGHETL